MRSQASADEAWAERILTDCGPQDRRSKRGGCDLGAATWGLRLVKHFNPVSALVFALVLAGGFYAAYGQICEATLTLRRTNGNAWWCCGSSGFRALKGPGLFLMIPILDQAPYWIDVRRRPKERFSSSA